MGILRKKLRHETLGSDGPAVALLDANLPNQPGHILASDVVEGALIFLFQPFLQVFRRDKTGFAIGQIAAGLLPKSDKTSVIQADDQGFAVDKELGIKRVGMACGNAVPDVRKAALIYSTGKL